MNWYEQKQAERKAGLEAAAAKHSEAAQATYRQARKMAEVIPFGQPIHVGHYSEKSDRAYRGRIDNKFGKSFDESNRAAELAAKAASVGTGGISSDDPDAIAKLTAEVESLESQQAKMKAANVLIRKKDTAGLVELLGEKIASAIMEPDCFGGIGFPSYRLSNNRQNIKRIRERIAVLEKKAELRDEVIECDGYTITMDTTENRIMFEFDNRQPEEVTAILKRYAFKWSPTRSAWVRMITGNAVYAARVARKEIDGVLTA